MKLGYESKGEFQAAYLNSILKSFFQGRNHDIKNSIESEIIGIMNGLAKVWDAAEEYEPKK
jgi:hypothetical protein